jgi:hypothetical protein
MLFHFPVNIVKCDYRPREDDHMRIFTLAIFLALALSFFNTGAQAQVELVENGSFETGGLTGWTRVQGQGSGGTWIIYTVGEFLPLPPPPDGDFAAVTTQLGASSAILYQDIEVPANSRVRCSAVVYYESGADGFVNGPGLSINSGPNHQARVDIMDPDAGDFDTVAGVLVNLFRTFPGFPFSLGYTTIEFDLTQYAGSTVRLRAGIAANQGVLNFALDEVTCTAEIASIPTLGEWGMIAMAGVLGLAGLIFARRGRSLTA